jgi:hypothetical protein
MRGMPASPDRICFPDFLDANEAISGSYLCLAVPLVVSAAMSAGSSRGNSRNGAG